MNKTIKPKIIMNHILFYIKGRNIRGKKGKEHLHVNIYQRNKNTSQIYTETNTLLNPKINQEYFRRKLTSGLKQNQSK